MSGARTAITVSDVFCLYPVPGGATAAALRGLTLRVPAGERLVVHGPNGSGKTTLLRVLTGEVTPSAGSVTVAGVEIAGAPRARLAALRRDVLGFVDQHSGRTLRPELDVLANIALQLRLAGTPRADARRRAAEVLGTLGLSGLAPRAPATLSAGEAQRVAVCAATAHRPAVLLADEPTGELDVDSAEEIYDLLADAAKQAGATLLIVTHDTRAARIADRVVRIRDGRLSEQWHPTAPHDEELVVDDRGWLRLPEPVRRRAGISDTVRVSERGREIVLRGDDACGTPAPGGPSLPEPRHAVAAPVAAAVAAPLGELREVGVRYGDRAVLRALSDRVEAGRLTVVHGRSGAGKSTVLRLLLGLSDPDTGVVLLGGRELAGLDRSARADLRRALAGVSLRSGALGETLDSHENLAMARAMRGLPDDPAAVAAALGALTLEPVAHRPARLLSGGERQRLSVARAIVVQRPLVVLDEPTSQQDEAHAERVVAALVALAAAGAAVVCATHDALLASAASHRMRL